MNHADRCWVWSLDRDALHTLASQTARKAAQLWPDEENPTVHIHIEALLALRAIRASQRPRHRCQCGYCCWADDEVFAPGSMFEGFDF